MTRPVLYVSVVALLGSACAPMAQAPLVYSSKTQAGVNFTTTSAETPGIEISLGYKTLNTAYVPVAVARPCDQSDTSTCTSGAYDILPVRGGNDVTFGVKPTEEMLTRAMNATSDANVALTAAEAALKARVAASDTAQAALTTARADRESKAKALAEVPPPPEQPTDGAAVPQDADAPARAAAKSAWDAAEITYKEAEDSAAKAQTAKTTAQAERDRAATRLAEEQNKVALLQRAISESGATVRTDALSVYGRFEGRADAKKTGGDASVSGVVGNVFSTGVASQYLAEGISRGLGTDAATECVRQGVELLGDVKGDARPARVDAILALCQSTTSAVRK